MNIVLVAGITVLAYALISVFSNKKAWISLGAAALLIIIGAAPFVEALRDYINWNVLAIYVGSLILAELFIYSRVPAVIAEWIANKSPSAAIAIALIALFAGLVSAFVENVATVLVVAPIAIEISRKVKVPLGPVMVLLAVNANLQGTATLVGDPPSMLFAGAAGFSFNDFFFYNGKPSIFFFVEFGAIIGAAYSFFVLRKHTHKEPVPRDSRVISWVPLLLLTAMVAGLAVNSIYETGVGARAGMICLLAALLGQVWFVLFRKEKLSEAMRIMGFMKVDNHLDPDLFDHFVRSGVYRAYAKKFLAPDLIDEVDEEALLALRPKPFALPPRAERERRFSEFLPEYSS